MKQMPSQVPTRAATSGPRSVEVKSSSRGAPSARTTQAYPEPDRGATTARLLDELHHTDDENEKAALRAEVVVLNMGVARAIAHRYRQRGLADGRCT